MSPIDRALTWEFIRRCRLFFVIYLLAAITVPLAFQGLFVLQGLDVAEIELDSRLYFLNFVAISLMAFTGAILAALVEGDSHLPTRLFTLPVSTPRIVATKMLAAAGMVIAGYLFIVGIYNLWLGTDWPFVTPLLFLVTATAGAQAGGWTLYDFSAKKVLATIAAAAGLIGWFVYRFAAVERTGEQVIDSHVYLGELVLLAAATALFYWWAVVAFDCSRRGDSRAWPDLSQLTMDAIARVTHPFSDQNKTFRTSESAMFWAEWRQKGFAIPIIALGANVIILGIAMFGYATPQMAAGLSIALVVAFPLAGAFLVGLCCVQNPVSKSLEMGDFTATRPVADTTLAWIPIKAGVASLILAWGICLLSFGGLFSWWAITGDGPSLGEHWTTLTATLKENGLLVSAALLPVVVLVAGCAIMGITGTVMLTGRGRVGATLMIAFEVAFVAWIAINHWFISEELRPRVLAGGQIVFGVATVLLTLVAFVRSTRLNYLSARTALLLGMVWLGLCAAVRYGYPTVVATTATAVFASGLLALSLFPVAAAPLAIRWNRHR